MLRLVLLLVVKFGSMAKQQMCVVFENRVGINKDKNG